MNERARYQAGYDLMAEIGSLLYQESRGFRPDVGSISAESYSFMEEIAEALIPYPCTDERWTEKMIGRLRDSVWANKEKEAVLFVILCQLCRQWQMSEEMLQYLPTSFSALNTNSEETGVLVCPKLRSLFEQERDPERRMLPHYKLIWREKLNGIMPVHHILPGLNILPNQKKLRIAYSPIGNYRALDIVESTKVDREGLTRSVFDVAVSSEKEEQIRRELKDAIRVAISQGADIFFTPEMVVPTACTRVETNPLTGEEQNRLLLEAIGSSLDPPPWTPEEKPGRPPKMPWLYVFSDWEANRNSAKIFDGHGHLIAEQDKLFPYVDEIHHTQENLVNPRLEVHILHVPPVGRICVMICKDYLEDGYRDMVAKQFEPSVILVPSCSKGIDAFVKASAAELYLGTQTVYGNTCISLQFFNKRKKPYLEPVGCFVCAPPRDIENYTMNPPVSVCENCENKTVPCVFTVDIPLSARITEESGSPEVKNILEMLLCE